MPAVAQFSSGAVKGDVFYVAGGELPPSSAPVVVKNLWMYYVPTDTWVSGAHTCQPRSRRRLAPACRSALVSKLHPGFSGPALAYLSIHI